jgi:predicted enzyme related to lactoylglutathione lyase
MNKLKHFYIHSSDTDKAKAFYEKIFDWKCNSFPESDEYYQISASDGSIIGAISSRRYNPDKKDIFGYECSISVDDVEATIQTVEESGGKTIMGKTLIPGVGWIAKFLDPDGNLFCAISYDEGAK